MSVEWPFVWLSPEIANQFSETYVEISSSINNNLDMDALKLSAGGGELCVSKNIASRTMMMIDRHS
jgi:hypothetical protein